MSGSAQAAAQAAGAALIVRQVSAQTHASLVSTSADGWVVGCSGSRTATTREVHASTNLSSVLAPSARGA
eukprot:1790102-Rhodomonas_salina.16